MEKKKKELKKKDATLTKPSHFAWHKTFCQGQKEPDRNNLTYPK